MLSINRKGEQGNSNEVLKIITAPWGFLSIVHEFENIVKEVFGEERLQRFFAENSYNAVEYEDLLYQFKIKFKCLASRQEDSHKILNITIPLSMADFYEREENKTLSEAFRSTKFSEKKKVFKYKFRIDGNLFLEECAAKVVNKIIEKIQSIPSGDLEDIKTVLLFGSFCEIGFVLDAVRKSFSTKHVVLLDYVGVLKGAVFIGHMVDN